MKNLLSATFARLFKGKLFWIGMLAMGGFGAVATIARARDAYVLQDMGYDTPDGLLFIGLTYFLITAAVFDSLFIGAEHADGTWRNKLIVGQGKVQIYLTYLIVTTPATLLMHLAYIGVVLGLSAPLLNPFFDANKDERGVLFLLTCHRSGNECPDGHALHADPKQGGYCS